MKTDFTLLPPNAIKLVAELLTKGLEKYPDEKWRRLSINDHLAAALRHINAYLRGEAFDEDSPSHLINAATRLLFAYFIIGWLVLLVSFLTFDADKIATMTLSNAAGSISCGSDDPFGQRPA